MLNPKIINCNKTMSGEYELEIESIKDVDRCNVAKLLCLSRRRGLIREYLEGTVLNAYKITNYRIGDILEINPMNENAEYFEIGLNLEIKNITIEEVIMGLLQKEIEG